MYPLKGLLIYPLPVVHYSFAPRAASFSLCMHGWHQCTKLMEHTADCVTVDIYSMKQCLLSRAARLSRLSWMTDNTGLCRTRTSLYHTSLYHFWLLVTRWCQLCRPPSHCLSYRISIHAAFF